MAQEMTGSMCDAIRELSRMWRYGCKLRATQGTLDELYDTGFVEYKTTGPGGSQPQCGKWRLSAEGEQWLA